MTARHGLGDGFVRCAQGHAHWGIFGAAGVLLVLHGQVLLAKRAAATHQGGTWSTPGGAIQHGEEPVAAALRELHEETGLWLADDWQLLAQHINDHGGWRYETFVLALAHRPPGASLQWETEELDWLTRSQVDALAASPQGGLHPDFRPTWAELRRHL